MSKRPRTTEVFVPELDRKVTVRAPTDGELKGDGRDVSTPELYRRSLLEIVGGAVISPKLTREQVEELSGDSIERICEANLRLHPKTAALLMRSRKGR